MPSDHPDRLDRNLPLEHLRDRHVPQRLKKIPKWILVSVVVTTAIMASAIILVNLNNGNDSPDDGAPDNNTNGTGTLMITVTNYNSGDRNVSLNFFAKQWITQFIAAGGQWSGSFQVNWTCQAPIIGVSATSDGGWHDRKTVQMIEGTVVGVSFVLS